MISNFYSWYIAVQVNQTVQMCKIPLPIGSGNVPRKPRWHVHICMSCPLTWICQAGSKDHLVSKTNESERRQITWRTTRNTERYRQTDRQRKKRRNVANARGIIGRLLTIRTCRALLIDEVGVLAHTMSVSNGLIRMQHWRIDPDRWKTKY
jgi:hypothetical protein